MFKVEEKVKYKSLNAKQKETYNFQKFSAIFAEYGFATIKLNDDWNGADFIAQHIDGERYLKVQLKGRLSFDKKYCGKNIYICFREKDNYYLYDHDKLLKVFLERYNNAIAISSSWINEGKYLFAKISREARVLLQEYLLE